ncbi:MAG: hypothetical protein IKI49_05110, partial [Oscillospiraceae bacterium]|nr:hypothetical protein [Oscillospiraceae bacterium]
MKHKTRKLLSILLALVMLAGLLPGAALADNTAPNGDGTGLSKQASPQGDSKEEFISGLIPEKIDLVFPTDKAPLRGAKNTRSLPSLYDTRNDTQTPVKNQGGNGICWTFGTYASLEANMNKNGMGTKDFSELHMAHSTSAGSADAENGFAGRTAPNAGGNRLHAISYLMRGGSFAGTVDEQDDPYTEIFKAIESRDPSISSGKTRTYRVKNAIFLSDDTPGDATAEAAAIKQAVMTYGGVAASMYWEGNAIASPDPNVASTEFFNAETDAYYYNCSVGSETNPAKTNHMVEIAGWDDSYPIENFKSNCRPKNPGAWLVKNS